MEEDIIDLLIKFSDKHHLSGEDNYFSDVEERIQNSGDIQSELPDLVTKIYECFQP